MHRHEKKIIFEQPVPFHGYTHSVRTHLKHKPKIMPLPTWTTVGILCWRMII